MWSGNSVKDTNNVWSQISELSKNLNDSSCINKNIKQNVKDECFGTPYIMIASILNKAIHFGVWWNFIFELSSVGNALFQLVRPEHCMLAHV